MVIDIDRFKQVNDSVGMALGGFHSSHLGAAARAADQAAGLAGAAVRRSIRPFAVVGARNGTHHRARRNHRRTVRAPITFNDREIFLTGSIGIAAGDGEQQRAEERLKDAELAMYYAKRNGGDRIDVFKPPMRARKSDRLSIESDLRRAIEREEISILYQPIVRLEDRAVAGFEALARWNHPRLGRMSPAEFITIAEEPGSSSSSACSFSSAPRGSSAPGSARCAPAIRVRQRQCLLAAIAAP